MNNNRSPSTALVKLPDACQGITEFPCDIILVRWRFNYLMV